MTVEQLMTFLKIAEPDAIIEYSEDFLTWRGLHVGRIRTVLIDQYGEQA